MRRLFIIALVAFVGCSFTGCEPAQTAITVPTSIDPTGATDVSAQMQAFFASVPDGAEVALPAGATFRMDSTLVLAGRSKLTIRGNGARFQAITPGDRARANIRILDSSDITIEDLTVVGANPAAGMGDAAFVSAKEAQHGIEAKSVVGLVLRRITVTDTYGDFLYLGRNEEHRWTSDVQVLDSHFARNGRMGVSLSATRNVLIANSTFDQMRRATFDLEAHHPGFGVDGLTVRDNVIGQGRLYLIAAVGIADVNHVVFQRNTVSRPLDILQSSEDGSTQRDWQILDNTSSARAGNPNLAAMRFDHIDGLRVKGNRQSFDTWRPMVGAKVTSSCNVDYTGNDYPGAVAQGSLTGTC